LCQHRAVSGRFKIDRASPLPVYVQLAEQIRLLVRRGALSPGDPLPTVRELAVALSLNANTVTRVYRDLQQEGLLRLERGLGTSVAPRQRREPTLADRDYQRIVKRTRELVVLCRESGLTARELAQLVEGIWKEVDREG
ncbi:MAG TPA: GntR family transcriptional regulator, partial [Myxococcaceae bacterium]|nr:GntR family transcriptional regulator [Myxococcaceae bacterium]